MATEKIIFTNMGNNVAVRSGKKEVNGVVVNDAEATGKNLSLVKVEDVLRTGNILVQGEQDFQAQTQLANTAVRKKAAECRMRVNCLANDTGKKTIFYIGIHEWAYDLMPSGEATVIDDELAANQGTVTFTGDIPSLKYFEWAIDTQGGVTIKNITVVAHHDGTPTVPMEKFHYNHLYQRQRLPGDKMQFPIPENSDNKEKKFPFPGSLISLDGQTFLRIEVQKGEDIEFIFETEIIQRANL
jgi:hypothetical protein